MFRYHATEEIRRYDLMKLGVLLLLVLLLILTWFVTRDRQDLLSGTGDETAATPVAESSGTEAATTPMPTLGIPSVTLPTEPLQPGSVTLSGTANPGAQVVVLVNGAPASVATAGVDGNWSATMELPPGAYTVQARTMDNVGGVAGESEAVSITVGGGALPVGPIAISPPGFDALTGTYVFTGTAAPGQTINVVSGGVVVGSATADEMGNFAVEVPAAAVGGEAQLQTSDATGAIVQQSEPLKLNLRPPGLAPSADMHVDPNSGALILPSRPEGLTLSGLGEPGTQVELLVNGARNTLAVVDAEGNWSIPIALPDGTYTFQFNTLDPDGNLLSSAIPATVAVGEAAAAAIGAPAAEATTTVPAESANQTIADVLAGRPEFSTLLSVLQSTGSLEILAQPGPFTAFAPANEAFANLPQRVIDGLNANPQILSQLLQYHIARGRYLAADLQTVQPATVNGRLLTVGMLDGVTTINDALVTRPDIPAINGVIHGIDRILVPPLVEGVRPPVIDTSGVSTFTGSFLTIVGTAEPGRTILVQLNGEAFGEAAVVGPDTTWTVSGNVTPGQYQIVAYMLGAADALEAISRPVMLQVNAQ